LEERVNYTLVGIFIAGSALLLVLAVLWLGKVEYEQEYDHYTIYFKESVSGLNVGSPVKYRGIKVGAVEALSINPQHPELVEVIIKVKSSTPIREDTRALLAYQGITGLAYIELTGGTSQSLPLKPKKTPPYPVIKTKPSIITRLDEVVTTLSQKTVVLVSRLNLLFSQENIKYISATLKNLSLISASISSKRSSLEETLTDLAKASKNLPQMVTQAKNDLDTVQEVLSGFKKDQVALSQLLDRLQAFLQDMGTPLAISAQDSMDELKQTLAEARKTLQTLKETMKQLEEHPSRLFFGGPPRRPGPGEKQ